MAVTYTVDGIDLVILQVSASTIDKILELKIGEYYKFTIG